MKGYDINIRPMGSVFALFTLAILGMVSYHSYVPEPDIRLVMKGSGSMDVSVWDTVHVDVKDGDTLRFYGKANGGRLWVETADGTRGWMENAPAFDIVSDDDISHEDLDKYYIHSDQGYYFTSLRHIEEYCEGRTFEEIDRKWRHADIVMKDGNGTLWAKYNKLAAMISDGTFYSVEICFDSLGYYKNTNIRGNIKDRNSWVLGSLPMAETIAGWDWVMWNVQETLYDEGARERVQWSWWRMLIVRIVMLIGIYILWALLPMLLPCFVYMTLLPKSSMRYVSSTVLVWGATLLTLAGSYIWLIAILCWGHTWLLMVPAAVLAVIGVAANFNALLVEQALQCCPQCGTMNSNYIADSKIISEREEWKNEEVRVRGYSKVTKEYTKKHLVEKYIQTKGGRGSNDYEREWMDIPYKEITTYGEYQMYKVKYHITVHDDTIKCHKCTYEKIERKEDRIATERIPEGKQYTKEENTKLERETPKRYSGDNIDIDYTIIK
jgi:hypothetical protein